MLGYAPNLQASALGPEHSLHAVYAVEWVQTKGKVSNIVVTRKGHNIKHDGFDLTGRISCLNSWGPNNDPEPLLLPGEYKLDISGLLMASREIISIHTSAQSNIGHTWILFTR